MALILPREKELVEFVHHSNLIEGESANVAHPLFQSHLEACRLVIGAVEAEWPLVHPRAIHEVLMAPEPHKLPGEYRPPYDPEKFVPRVGKEPLLPAHLVPGRMTDLWTRVREGPSKYEVAEWAWGIDVAEWAWGVHDDFERIHPFCDGNGRTGRMFMNGLRLMYGLPWLTVRIEDRAAYLARFR